MVVASFFVAVLSIIFLAMIDHRLESGIPNQYFAIFFGFPFSALVLLGILAANRKLTGTSAFTTVSALSVVFFCVALSYDPYETVYWLQQDGHTIRIERRPYEFHVCFTARWRAPHGSWSDRYIIEESNKIREKYALNPTFKISTIRSGVWQIRDGQGVALKEFGPGVPKE